MLKINKNTGGRFLWPFYLTNFRSIVSITGLLLILLNSACRKFIEVPAPSTSINGDNVYTIDATAISVVTGFYTSFSQGNMTGFASTVNPGSVFFPCGLSSDELVPYNLANGNRFYTNSLSSTDGSNTIWTLAYNYVFKSNAAVEGLTKSTTLTPAVKQQLLGEAKFFRAFCYFYLVNLYGGVPLALSTDPEVNRLLSRSSVDVVYQQIIDDLKEAQELLSDNFLGSDLLTGTNQRIRPTKWAATALLARVYLYNKQYQNAKDEATSVINQTTIFYLEPDLNAAFLMNSHETIWALQPVMAGGGGGNYGYNTGEGRLSVLPATGPNTLDNPAFPVYLSDYIVNSFEPGDLRRINWIDSVTVGPTTYNYAYKYKAGLSQTTVTEYSIVFRLSELFLIRAEANARLNNIAGAAGDLNTIRDRARATATVAIPNPLPVLSSSLSQTQLYTAVEHERQTELFTEWGHRWLDLKRTSGFTDASKTRADEVMPAITSAKGGTWDANWKLYPIPQSEISLDPNLKNAQNPGYN